MAQAIMFQGTGSDVGKTVLVAGFCRLAANRGIKVAPFKPQNMSNNAAIADNGEIGRGQWLQALASRIEPTTDMNPVLLKPQSEIGSQVIVQGKVWGQAKAREYKSIKPKLLSAVLESYERLNDEYDLVIVEGAGSPAEINLRDGDIANMGFATAADVSVVLVGDIDRGGVIASIVGTHHILPDQDRDMIVGYLINKFRGDVSLFDDGIEQIKKFTDWPCFGVVPWLKAASNLPAEDSVILDKLVRGTNDHPTIAILKLPRMANFDDFDPLFAEPNINVQYVEPDEDLPPSTKLAVIPGSKSTIADLEQLKANGWQRKLAEHHQQGGAILGVCGGFQMLGHNILDPDKLEGNIAETEGLGFLDVETSMEPQKVTENTVASSTLFDAVINGYEIHLGRTIMTQSLEPFSMIGERGEGAVSADGLVFGTYLHGLFTSDDFRQAFLKKFDFNTSLENYNDLVDEALDDIAEELEKLVDFDRLLEVARSR